MEIEQQIFRLLVYFIRMQVINNFLLYFFRSIISITTFLEVNLPGQSNEQVLTTKLGHAILINTIRTIAPGKQIKYKTN